MRPANDSQVGGTHYSSSYQPWELTYDLFEGDFCLGNANKYITRWRKKNGAEDLKKALHYLNKRMELEHLGRVKPITPLSYEARETLLTHYAIANDIGTVERQVLDLMAMGAHKEAYTAITQLLA